MADKVKETDHALGGTAIKPVGWDRTGFEAFRYMIYNPDTGEVLNRSAMSWAKIIAFYVVYYCFLAGFWIAALNVFFMSLPEVQNGPSWKLDSSLIGANPGVGLRPKNSDKLIDSQMFVLKQGDRSVVPSKMGGEGETNADYATRLENFLEVYTTESEGYNKFELSELGDCQEFPYGYVETEVEGVVSPVAPCIVVKLNTIWDWTPVPVGSDYIDNDGKELPKSLKEHVKGIEDAGGDTDMVWIDCHGRYAADQEALSGLEYFPKTRGFPMKYFPYQGRGVFNPESKSWEKTYHTPLVAIKVTPNSVGQLIHIQCKAYYDGVVHVSKDKQGMVQFEVQVKTNI